METKRQRLEKLHSSLKRERTTWDPYWRDLADYILPRRSRFLTTNRNKGDKRNQKIIDNTGTLAARTLKSGMHSGITSPARPWFSLTVPDPDLAEYGPVKEWLYRVTKRMQTMFARSNIYNALPVIYGDTGVFGTAACGIFEDGQDMMRAYTYPVGSYYLACNSRGVVDTWIQDRSMTVRQMVQEYGLDNVSMSVKNMYDRGDYEEWIDVVQTVSPNEDYDPRRPQSKYKRYQSCHYEQGQSKEGKFLREAGFDEFPILGPRWDTTGEDVYGYSPGMDAIGDIKSLQVMQKDKAKAGKKMIDPPMIGDPALSAQKASLLPGDITYVSDAGQRPGFRPAHEVRYDMNPVLLDIQDHRERINSAFFADLFLMLAMADKRMTATEVAERHEEKLLMLGPVLERLNDELLGPLIDRSFNIMVRSGTLPPPPPELEGMDLRVEYTSILAQAQKMVATATVDRFMGFVGNLAAVDQSVVDKVDMDQAVDEYGDMMGVPPSIIRSDEDVADIRRARAEAARAQAQAERMQTMAQGAKTLSETDMDTDSALNRILSATTGGGV